MRRTNILIPQNERFVGREDMFMELDRLCSRRDEPTARVVSLSGPPGMGKSALVRRYAARRADMFADGRFLVSGALAPEAALARLAPALGLDVSDMPESCADQVLLVLSHLPNFLLVVDGADTSDGLRAWAEYLQQADIAAILTTTTVGEHFPEVALGPLTDEESGEVLAIWLKERHGNEKDSLSNLTRLLGGWPLLVNIAATHLHLHPDVTADALAASVRSGSVTAMEHNPASSSTYRATVSDVMRRVSEGWNAAERELLVLAARLPDGFIFPGWVVGLAKTLRLRLEPVLGDDRDPVVVGVDWLLAAYCSISNADTGLFELNSIIRSWVLSSWEEPAEHVLAKRQFFIDLVSGASHRSSVELVGAARWMEEELSDTAWRDRMAPSTVIALAERLREVDRELEAGSLLDSLAGTFVGGIDAHLSTSALAREVIRQIAVTRLGLGHAQDALDLLWNMEDLVPAEMRMARTIEWAAHTFTVAQCLRRLGRSSEAVTLLRQVAGVVDELGSMAGHYRRAIGLALGSELVVASVNDQEGFDLLLEAFESYRRLGDKDGEYYRAVVAFARAQLLRGRPDLAATQLDLVADDVNEGVSPSMHVNILAARAACQDALGLREDAEAIYRDLIDYCVEHLGPSHQLTVNMRFNRGQTLVAPGAADESRFASGLLHIREALAQSVGVLGATHGDVIVMRFTLGSALLGAGKVTEALAICERAYNDATAALPPDHRERINASTHYARCLAAVGRKGEALELATSAYHAFMGAGHPHSIVVLQQIGDIQHDSGDHEAAKATLSEALRIARDSFGGGHSRTVTICISLASVLLALAEADVAARELLAVWDVVRQEKASDSDDVVDVLVWRSKVAAAAGKKKSALAYIRQADTLIRKRSGAESGLALQCRRTLANRLLEAGRQKEARRVLRECLRLANKLHGTLSPEAVAIAERLRRIPKR